MTEETSQTNQTATDQTAQPAQTTDATQATQAINAESTTSTNTGSTTGSTTGVTVGITTEATNQTATDQTAQPAQATTAPQELAQKEFWVSGMLNGTFYECDGPYYTTKVIPAESYPYTTVTPNPRFTSQKYDYISHKWVDTSADALLHKMESMKTDINSFQQMATTLQQRLDSQSQAQQAQDEEARKAMSLLNMVIKQTGTISDKIDGISTKLSASTPAATTDATTPTATTTQTASTTTTTDAAAPTGSTTQMGSATPTATTAQTADEAKKEGTN